MFPLFETIKVVDGKAMHLQWHQQRMEASFQRYFGSPCQLVLDELIPEDKLPGDGICKCRFLYGRNAYELEFEPYVPRKIESLKLIYEPGIDYSMKFSDRSSFEVLLKQKGGCDEILIVQDNLLTDTSFSNIALCRGELWYTPKIPLLKGTLRERLIAEGKLIEKNISPGELKTYSRVKLINAMLGLEDTTGIPVDCVLL